MTNFALTRNEFATGDKVSVCNLEIDGICQFHAFIEELEEIQKKELRKLSISIWQLSENIKPRNRNHLKGKDLMDCRELKTKNLRLYYLVLNSGLVICLGGVKTKQKKDIQKLKTLKFKIIKFIQDHGEIQIGP